MMDAIFGGYQFFDPVRVSGTRVCYMQSVILSAASTVEILGFQIVLYLVEIHSVAVNFQKPLFASADIVIAVSKIEVEQYLEHGVEKSKIKQIPHGVDINFFRPKQTDRTFFKKWGVAESDKVVLFIGRVNPIKGI